MNQRRMQSIFRLSLIWAACFLILGGTQARGAATQPLPEQDGKTLSNDECVLCHADVIQDIEEAGGAHKESLTCTDCHNGHPPQQLEIIPACRMCHSGEPHFELEQCLS